MPSFRAVLQITGLRAGNPPEAVMDTAVLTMGSVHLVEASSLDVVRGVPTITVRFLVEATSEREEDNEALTASAMLRQGVEQVATTGRLSTLRRRAGKWIYLG
ncbi:hypothetical protein [Psychromicrobium xiongbiense]|uniref:hypothetical protein n=1 Tax=Psychromicrobium xiongbiense TaxID=3051184 RepID=UPI002555C5F4|nr:hypothetical protein [Psychromicrobium sp. YIM S02556]